ncbi:hypothetical protein OTU49_014345 [Cherax quadricarinatus]|uniref:Uncharacterized protein n=3 Tax=Cherax quadricarinatus TaxID=27406 RepID=A0AAW0YI54_CHEQU
MGPGDSIEIQRLVDLPSRLSTAAEQRTQHTQSIHRVRSMLQTSGKLAPPRLPQGPEPPRRSFSHQPLPQPHYSNVHNGSGPPPMAGSIRRTGMPPLPPTSAPQHLPPQRSPEEPRHQIIHQLQEQECGDTSPRHSIASNTSSNLSSPPSPGRPPDHHSSSYDS